MRAIRFLRLCGLESYICGETDVPVWLLGELDIRPDRIHGLNYETSFENPFPLEWSPELAQVIGSIW
ncbi:hypothetical protein C9J85_08465 [Haloferax sp. wsp5]|nr:hypothetical protein C9J85_08465 [Haloferax sp. wsp5]